MQLIVEHWCCFADSNSETSSETITQARKKSRLGSLYDALSATTGHEAARSETPRDMAQKQIDTFKTLASKDPALFDDDPLIWWKRYKSTLPDLAILVRSYLAIQATSVASERLFSRAGYIVSKLRTSLKSDNVTMLTFLATNSEMM